MADPSKWMNTKTNEIKPFEVVKPTATPDMKVSPEPAVRQPSAPTAKTPPKVPQPPPPKQPTAQTPPEPAEGQYPNLQKYVKDGQVDLVQIAKAADEAALTEARKVWGPEAVSDARALARTPVTPEVWRKLGPGTRRKCRLVTPVSVEEWNRMSDREKIHHYPEASGVKPEVYARLGPGVRRYAYPKLTTWQKLTPWKEEEGEKATSLRGLTMYGEIVVPGVYLGRHWDELSVPEKVGHGLLDALVVGSLIRPGVRAAGKLSQLLRPATKTKEVRYTLNAAKKAGEAHANLQRALSDLKWAERLPGTDVTGARTNVVEATSRSLTADKKFLQSLSGLKEIDRPTLRKLEKLSKMKATREPPPELLEAQKRAAERFGIRNPRLVITPRRVAGLRKAVEDVNKLQEKLKKQWARLERWQREYKFEPGRFDPAEEAVKGKFHTYQKMLTDVNETKSKLDRALVRLGERMRPRVKETRAPEFEGYEMRWEEMFKPEGGIGKASDDFSRLLKDAAREFELKKLSQEVGAKELERLGLAPERGGVATAARAPAPEGRYSLRLVPKFGEARAAEAVEAAAPRLRPSAKLTLTTLREGRISPVKIARPEAARIVAMTPAQLAGATPAEIAQFHALQTISTTMAKPVTEIDTEPELKTADRINEQYQRALSQGLEAATSTYSEVLNRTGSRNKTRTAAEEAVEAAIENTLEAMPKAETKAEARTQARLKTTLKTEVKTAVREILRFKTVAKLAPLGPGDIEIEEVKGIPKRPGVVSWNQGIVRISVKPPYRKGGKDVRYRRLKPPQTGEGSPQQTIAVKRGNAPELIRLDMGITDAIITKGRRITFVPDRATGPAKPALMLPNGKLVRQRRGTVLR